MKIIRILFVRDEDDVLDANLRWYERTGIETVAIDNGSVDGSAEILRAAEREGRIKGLAALPPASDKHDWRNSAALHRLGQELADRERPDVQLLAAADEFFETGDGAPLRTAIESDIETGFSVLDFKNMEFHMTDRDDAREGDVMRRLRHYSHRQVEMYRGIRWAPGIDLATNLGHRPVLPAELEWRVSPRLYVSRHYPLRSREQFERKIRRVRPRPDRPSTSTQYLRLCYGEAGPKVPRDYLTRYDEDHRWVLEEKELRWRLRHTTYALAHAHYRVDELERRLG